MVIVITSNMRRNAFSLIEIIGVLAVISILSALLVPMAVSQYDRAAWVREGEDLSAITNALVMSILQSNVLPSEATWANAVASQMPESPANITTTPRKITRYFKLDPNLTIPTDTSLKAGVTRASVTNGARAMLISTIGTPLVGADLLPANFNAVWNTPDNQKPAGWTWPGKGEDLKIQRINFEPLFHRLKLSNQSSTFIGQYSINNGPTTQLLAPLDLYYLDGSFVSLRDVNGQEQASQLLTSDASFVFDMGFWQLQPASGFTTNNFSQNYGMTLTNFLTALPYTGQKPGSSPQAALMLINSFMQAYEAWADGTPCFSMSGSTSLTSVVVWQNLVQITSNLTNVTVGLVP